MVPVLVTCELLTKTEQGEKTTVISKRCVVSGAKDNATGIMVKKERGGCYDQRGMLADR